MRILYFTRDYTPHDHRFLAALAQSGHQVAMLRLERRAPQREDRPIPAEIEQIFWRGGLAPARWQDAPGLLFDLKRVLRQYHPDLVHAGTLQTAAFLTALAGFHPLVSMSWGSDLLRDADRSRAWRWATVFTLKRSRVLLGDCQAVHLKAVQLGFPAERIVTFPWGVDLHEFSPAGETALRSRLGWQDHEVSEHPKGCFVLLSLRSWEPIYGVDVLVRAFIAAAQEQPALRLMLLGTGSLAGQLRQMIEQSGLGDRVHFGGQVNHTNLVHYYRASDLYLSASHSDGSSVSLMEALACGLPVLVSDIPSNREWITPDVQGWLFPDGDSGALAQQILAAYAQKDNLSTIGKASRALAEQRADWQSNFKQLLAAYELAVQPGRLV